MTSPIAGPDDLDLSTRAALQAIVEQVSADPSAPSSVRDPEDAWRVHIADSLSGLEVEALREAGSIADVGAGAGFPGLPG